MDLADLAAAQSGVFSREQARARGWSAYRIRRRIESGEWQEVFGGRVLCAAGIVRTAAVLRHAALLALPGGSLAGPSASALHGITVPWPSPVVAVAPVSRREPTGITVIRDRVAVEDLRLIDDLLLTSRPRTVMDCLMMLPDNTGRTFLDRALQLQWLGFDELVERTHQLAGRHGAPRLRRQVRIAALGVRSEGERVLRRILVSAGIVGWVPNWELPGVAVLDYAFPAVRLALEVDGRAWHSADERFQRDRTRQNELVSRGWTILRFTWEDLTTRPKHVVATIQTTLDRL